MEAWTSQHLRRPCGRWLPIVVQLWGWMVTSVGGVFLISSSWLSHTSARCHPTVPSLLCYIWVIKSNNRPKCVGLCKHNIPPASVEKINLCSTGLVSQRFYIDMWVTVKNSGSVAFHDFSLTPECTVTPGISTPPPIYKPLSWSVYNIESETPTCISYDQVCDFEKSCPKGDDESLCGTTEF